MTFYHHAELASVFSAIEPAAASCCTPLIGELNYSSEIPSETLHKCVFPEEKNSGFLIAMSFPWNSFLSLGRNVQT